MVGGMCFRGVCGGGAMHVWWGACVVGGMCGGWDAWRGACMAGDMHGRGHAWQGGMCGGGGVHVWHTHLPLHTTRYSQ